MSPPNILVLSPFFHPETISTGRYNTFLVRALHERGASVEVVASHPLYPAWRPARAAAEADGVPVHRGGAWVRYPRSPILRRIILELWFAFHAAWTTLRLRRRVSLVVAVFPPTLFFVLCSWLLPRSATRVGIVHDLQARMGLRTGVVHGWLRRLVHAVEAKAFRSCDRLVLLSHGMQKAAVEDFGLDPRKTSVCLPFVSVASSAVIGTSLTQQLPSAYRHVVYSGALGEKQDSARLVEFFRRTATRFRDVHFHVFSAGPLFDRLRAMHADAPQLHFHPLVADSDLEELYARSTVQVISQSDASSNACMPSKLPNILASGCAVFAICEPDSELAEILDQAGIGATGRFSEREELAERLARLLDITCRQDRQQRQARVSALLDRLFSLDRLVDVVLDGPAGQQLSQPSPHIEGTPECESRSS